MPSIIRFLDKINIDKIRNFKVYKIIKPSKKPHIKRGFFNLFFKFYLAILISHFFFMFFNYFN